MSLEESKKQKQKGFQKPIILKVMKKWKWWKLEHNHTYPKSVREQTNASRTCLSWWWHGPPGWKNERAGNVRGKSNVITDTDLSFPTSSKKINQLKISNDKDRKMKKDG